MQDRIRFIRLLFMVTVMGIILRLGYWQIMESDNLAARAENQHLFTRQVLAPRGEILFSDGATLATTQPAYLVFAQPKIIDRDFKNPQALTEYKKYYAHSLALQFNQMESTAEATPTAKLEDRLKDLENDLLTQLNKDLYWVSLQKTVTFEQKKMLEKLNLPGLGFEGKSQRFYPEGSSSAHLLGFVGSDIYGEEQGYFGLEGFYDGELRGKKGFSSQEKDALGVPILIGNFKSRQAKKGKSLILNIDRSIQYMVEQKLKLAVDHFQAKSGSVVVMEPKSGAVLALASYPSYDPAKVQNFPKENFKDPLIGESFEPGSTFKVLVMASAINEGVATDQTVCSSCDGPVQVGGYTIRTWNNKYYPNSTMTDVIIHSDNTGMVYVTKKLGLTKLFSYLQSFGVGKPTGVDLEDEDSPSLRAEKDWKEIDLATASFGQGISTTALQMVRAVAAIANGGKLLEPHVVSRIEDGTDIFAIKPKIVGQPISKKTAQQVKEMMVKAVEQGEAKYAKPKGYKIAGKTGTAQIPVAGHYDPNKTIASFVGFAPADDPRFVMMVKFVEPQGSIFGAETAAPVFFDIAKELFTYYGIAPDE